MMQRTPSLAFHSQQSLSFGTPTQQLSFEQEQPFVPYIPEDHSSFGGSNQALAQSWTNDISSGSRPQQESRRQAYSPAGTAPQGHAPPATSSTSFMHLSTTTTTNGKRMKTGYDGMTTLPIFGRAPTLLSEKETDAEMGSTLQSQKNQQQQWQRQQQQQEQQQSQSQSRRLRFQQQQQQTNKEPQHQNSAAQDTSTAVLHPSIPSYLRPYISDKPIVARSTLDKIQGDSESHPSMASSLFSQSREIRTLLDKITSLDGTLDGFDRRMVDYHKQITDGMVSKDDALSMFESKAGEKVVETLQRQGTEVIARLKEQAVTVQEMQGRHLDEGRKDLLNELGKMTTLWQQQIGKLQEIQGEWKEDLWKFKAQVQEELASEMNALRSAIALQSHMLTMISEQNRRILEERNLTATRSILSQKFSTSGGGNSIGIRHSAQGQEPTLASNSSNVIVPLLRPTEKATTAKESGKSGDGSGRGRGRPRGRGRGVDLGQGIGAGRRGRGRPSGKARRTVLEAQLVTGIDAISKRQEHSSGTLQHNPSQDQDMVIESEQPPVSVISHKSSSDGHQQGTRHGDLPHGVVFDEQSALEDDLSFDFPVLTRSRRREYDLRVPFLDLDHRERPRHANQVG